MGLGLGMWRRSSAFFFSPTACASPAEVRVERVTPAHAHACSHSLPVYIDAVCAYLRARRPVLAVLLERAR